MSCASSGHITKLKQSIFAPFDIYARLSLTIVNMFIVKATHWFFIIETKAKAGSSGTVAEHLTRHPKVKGSSPSAASGNEG
jgi:hypothetical protein